MKCTFSVFFTLNIVNVVVRLSVIFKQSTLRLSRIAIRWNFVNGEIMSLISILEAVHM